MTPETETETDMGQGYCKAGFAHVEGAECGHVVTQGPAKYQFEVPKEYYSAEATAARKAENREKYKPKRQQARRELFANEAKQIGEW